jgi:hypothetical protein
MEPGTRVEVRTRFDQRWSRGFEVADVVPNDAGAQRYLIRRRSDDTVLPTEFGAEEIRSEKKSRSMWWM